MRKVVLILILFAVSVAAVKPETVLLNIGPESMQDVNVQLESGEQAEFRMSILELDSPAEVKLSLLKEEGLTVMQKSVNVTPEDYKVEQRELFLRFNPDHRHIGPYFIRVQSSTAIKADLVMDSIPQPDAPLGGDRSNDLYSAILPVGRHKGHLATSDQRYIIKHNEYLDLKDTYLIQVPKGDALLVRVLPSSGAWISMELKDVYDNKLYQKSASKPDEVVGAIIRSTNKNPDRDTVDVKFSVSAVENIDGGGPYSIELSFLDNMTYDQTVSDKELLIHPVFEGPERERPTVVEELYHPPYLFLIGLLSIIATGLAISIYVELINKKLIHKPESHMQEMIEYIETSLKRGFPKHAIHSALTAARWSEEEIEKAFYHVMFKNKAK